MTREEAFKKLNALNYDMKEGVEYTIKTFEALGLIKFEEPKTVADILLNIPIHVRVNEKDIVCGKLNNYFVVEAIERALAEHGYRIVKS